MALTGYACNVQTSSSKLASQTTKKIRKLGRKGFLLPLLQRSSFSSAQIANELSYPDHMVSWNIIIIVENFRVVRLIFMREVDPSSSAETTI
jgi:hypothetical protein